MLATVSASEIEQHALSREMQLGAQQRRLITTAADHQEAVKELTVSTFEHEVAKNVTEKNILKRRVTGLEEELVEVRGELETHNKRNKRQRVEHKSLAVIINDSAEQDPEEDPICVELEREQMRRELEAAETKHQDTLKELEAATSM
ncbi:hypothetical protein PHYPSEUDO_011908 [Phytophthora pseudosyringae]|uniref:Uncharacterized protein n=1 Tax=Phytophthora pseudosyringae TaxID=221518 RepID=A0A8T1W5S0_9STRA|nr:hypothetical protein PHYPSEUDO_011908 [Phytophthora pseudosyringae]